MKKAKWGLLIVTLATCLLMVMGCGTSDDSKNEKKNPDSDGLAYQLTQDGSGYEVIGIGTCTDTDIGIPATYEGKPVVGIGEEAFRNCCDMTSITIPNSVTYIGDFAFESCSGLTHLTIPNSVTSISEGTFSDCSGLTSITIPDTVTDIGIGAFHGCSALTCIDIPDSVISMGEGVFSGCSGLTSITIPDGIINISEYMFLRCTSLTSITLPDSLTDISKFAFADCSSLANITIPANVTSIGYGAFASCFSLSNIMVAEENITYHVAGNCLIETAGKIIVAGFQNSVIPTDGSVTGIGEAAFYGYTGLTSIIIPDSVVSIGDSAFYGCTGLTSIIIPDSVTSIGSSAFYGCTGLTSIIIPDSVVSIGERAFYGCTDLTRIIISDNVTNIGYEVFYDTAYYNDESNWTDGVLYIDHALIDCKVEKVGTAIIVSGTKTIKDGTTCIANYAFSDCLSIIIPDSVVKIGEKAFWNCDLMTNITFTGTKAQWAMIEKGSSWKNESSCITIHCIDGDTIEEGT